jgi:hypothetical protein
MKGDMTAHSFSNMPVLGYITFETTSTLTCNNIRTTEKIITVIKVREFLGGKIIC